MSALHDYIDPIAIDAPVSVTHPLVHAEGIYFGFPEDEYHGALALSASGIKWLRVSPLDWWARSPLNPEHEDDGGDTEAKIVGRAYHKRIVEGLTAFRDSYAPALDPADHPNALRTVEEIKAALATAGGPEKGLSGVRKAELAVRLREYDPDAELWDRLVEAHAEIVGDRAQLPAPLIRKIEIAAAMIEKNPHLARAFTGGMPEVSIFWTDRNTGTPRKARIDYLKSQAVVDLKSFDHQGRPLDKAIARAVAAYKYHIQTAFYLDAAAEAKRLIRKGAVFGDAPAAYLDALAASAGHTFLYVWQAKGIAPLAIGKVLNPGSVLDIARMEIDQATHLWARCWQTYGPDEPWLAPREIETFSDEEFPVFLSE